MRKTKVLIDLPLNRRRHELPGEAIVFAGRLEKGSHGIEIGGGEAGCAQVSPGQQLGIRRRGCHSIARMLLFELGDLGAV